jgi:hypothetical protein
MIDPVHFQDLSEKDPEDVCRRALCRYDRTDRKYNLTMWGADLWIFPFRQAIEPADSRGRDLHPYFHLVAIHYLLGAKASATAGTWISEKEVPGGATFFRGPHRIPTEMVSRPFDNDLGAFRKRCESLGGRPLPMADAAFTFQITERIPLAVLLWCGDEEFPADCKILYDETIQEHLATDIIYALAVGACRRLGTAP